MVHFWSEIAETVSVDLQSSINEFLMILLRHVMKKLIRWQNFLAFQYTQISVKCYVVMKNYYGTVPEKLKHNCLQKCCAISIRKVSSNSRAIDTEQQAKYLFHNYLEGRHHTLPFDYTFGLTLERSTVIGRNFQVPLASETGFYLKQVLEEPFSVFITKIAFSSKRHESL